MEEGKKEAKQEEKEREEKKEGKAAKEELPLPPSEIVLKVHMHCEGCARKVRRCLKGFDGVDLIFLSVWFGLVWFSFGSIDGFFVVVKASRLVYGSSSEPSPRPSMDQPFHLSPPLCGFGNR